MKLITLQNLKEELKIITSDDDDILNKLIERISLIIEKYIWHALDERIITEYHDWWENIIFADLPIVDENTIKITNKSTWYELTVDHIEWRAVYLTEDTNEWVKNIKLEYKTWYQDESKIPSDIVWVAVDWIGTHYNSYKSQDWTWIQNPKMKSKKIDSLSITYFSSEENKAQGKTDNLEILDQYKLKDFI